MDPLATLEIHVKTAGDCAWGACVLDPLKFYFVFCLLRCVILFVTANVYCVLHITRISPMARTLPLGRPKSAKSAGSSTHPSPIATSSAMECIFRTTCSTDRVGSVVPPRCVRLRCREICVSTSGPCHPPLSTAPRGRFWGGPVTDEALPPWVFNLAAAVMRVNACVWARPMCRSWPATSLHVCRRPWRRRCAMRRFLFVFL